MIEAIIGVVATLLGTAIGFFLSEWSSKRKEDKEEEKRIRSTRTILLLEMNANLKMLRDFWTQVSCVRAESESKDVDVQKRQMAEFLIENPSISWTQQAFESQLSFFAIAFTSEQILSIFHFYERFRTLGLIRKELINTKNAEKASRAGSTEGSRMGMLPPGFDFTFYRIAPELWDKYEYICSQLLEEGNPVLTG